MTSSVQIMTYPLFGTKLLSEPWWRHQMETFSALLAICAGNSPVHGEFPAQRPVTRSFDVPLICARIYGWVNNHEAGDLRRHHSHYDVIVMHMLTCWQIGSIKTNFKEIRIKIQNILYLKNIFQNITCILPRLQWVNSSFPGQNGRHFADDIFRCIFFNEKICITNKFSLKFVPKGQMDGNTILV